jgi:hypothetical protein
MATAIAKRAVRWRPSSSSFRPLTLVRILLTGEGDMDTAVAASMKGISSGSSPSPAFTTRFNSGRRPGPAPARRRGTGGLAGNHGDGGDSDDVLSAIQPVAFRRASRLCEMVLPVSRRGGTAGFPGSGSRCDALPAWRYLCRHPRFEAPPGALRGTPPPSSGASLRGTRLQSVSHIIERQYQKWQSGDHSDSVALGAQLLHVALDFDRLIGMGQSRGRHRHHARVRR